MSLSTSVANQLNDQMFGNAAPTFIPGTWYIGLLTAPAIADGTGFTEVAGGSYTRVAVTNNTTNFPNSVSGAKTNGTLITFPTASAGWGDVTHVGFFDASTGGLLRAWKALATPRTILAGDEVRFQAGDLGMSVS